LPYSQTNTGSINFPSSPRVVILSSVGSPLPSGITNGVATSANFTNIWNTADGTVPASAPAFAGWAGGGATSKSSVLIYPVVRSFAAQLGRFFTCRTAIPSTRTIGGRNRCNKHSLRLAGLLYPELDPFPVHTYGLLDSQQILIRDNSFVYDQDTWRGSIGGQFFLGGVDIASAVDRYLAAFRTLKPRTAPTSRQLSCNR